MAVMMVISTHLDDAVLSIGKLLSARPGAIVLTVFAGAPTPAQSTEYDARGGFADSRQAALARRAEDRAGLSILGAEPRHADLVDHQYGVPATDDEVAEVVSAALAELRPDVVLGPVGLFHPDHEQVGRVWPTVAARHPVARLIAYEDLPYRVQRPKRATAVVGEFTTRHAAVAEPVTEADDARHEGRKATAMLAYASQLRFVAPLSCLAEERLWRLHVTADRPSAVAVG